LDWIRFIDGDRGAANGVRGREREDGERRANDANDATRGAANDDARERGHHG
jgi:hypothetical protein